MDKICGTDIVDARIADALRNLANRIPSGGLSGDEIYNLLREAADDLDPRQGSTNAG